MTTNLNMDSISNVDDSALFFLDRKGKKRKRINDFQNDESANRNTYSKRQFDVKIESRESDSEISLSEDKTREKTLVNDPVPQKHVYFEKILKALRSGVPDDSRDLFVINALEESKDLEVKLSCHSYTSHCFELLLSLCKDPDVWIQFMTAFSKEKETVCSNANACHVAELLIHFSVQSIKNWSSVLESEEESKEKEQITFFLSWIAEFGDFVSENVINCLENQYASHVACSVIRALGGDMTGNSEFMSKRSLNHKKEFSSKYIGEDALDGAITFAPVTLESIPKWFKEKLKAISKAVRKIENISEYVTESYCATVIEALIFILEKRSPKQCRKFIKEFAVMLFSAKSSNGMPLAFVHKNCSFIVEKLFQAADEDFQHTLWDEYIVHNLEYLVIHRIGNYVIQRLFDVVKNQNQLQVMCEKTGELFEKIIQAEHYGIFLSIAAACNRLKAHQALFVKDIMQCLQCSENEDKQSKLIPLLLSFKKYDNSDSELTICLQGSLLVQNILTFQKPIKLVKSLLSMKPQELAYLACHIQGCHVLTSFFKSVTVGEKSKDKLIQCLQPVMPTIVCDRNGSLTLSRIWVLLSLKQKGAIADILLRSQETIKSNKNGNIVFDKFKIYLYKNRYEQWKDVQLQFLQK